jgi:hypothetical protein
VIVAVDGLVGEFKPVNGALLAYVNEAEKRVVVEYAGLPVEAGVTYYTLDEQGVTANIDPRSGKYTIKGRGMAKFRAVCGKSHRDLIVQSSL